VLEWARAQKVVHRAVSMDTLFLEPGSDRVQVAFAVRPLPRAVMPGPEEDARTIGALARAMLTRSAAAPERASLPLAELRPGLPVVVIEQTDALLQLSRTSTNVPDVTGYIAAIAMAEALKEGEIHLEKTRHIIEEQQRLHREQLEKERREHNEQLATEQKTHAQEVAEQAKRFQKEREEFELKLTRERKALEKEQEALAKERAAHAKDCAALTQEREAHERDVQEMREKLEWESAALATQAERYAARADLETDLVLPDRDEDRPRRPAFVPPVMPPRAARAAKSAGPSLWSRAARHRPHWNSRWNVPAAAVVLVLLIGLTVYALGGVGGERPRTLSSQAPARVVDSVAGTVSVPVETLHAVPASSSSGSLPAAAGVPADLVAGVASRSGVARPTAAGVPVDLVAGVASRSGAPRPTAAGVPADLLAGVAARADSAPAWVPVRRQPVVRRDPNPVPAQRMESWSVTQPPGAGTTVRIDTIIGSSVRVDSVRRGGATIRRDSIVRDTLVRRDSIRP
jgi:hypothetical protein